MLVFYPMKYLPCNKRYMHLFCICNVSSVENWQLSQYVPCEIFLGTIGDDNIVISSTNTKIDRHGKAFPPIIYTGMKGLGKNKPTCI